MITRDEVRHALTGPITAIHPVFDRDGSLDLSGIRHCIEHNLAAGSRTMLLTYGDSLHSLLTDQEVGELLRVVVEQTRRRAMVVAADRQWWLGKELEFAAAARDIGADVLMVLPPNWAGSNTVDDWVAHYGAVAGVLPVMLVTAAFTYDRPAGLETIRRLADEVPGVVAIKDDLVGEFARRMALLVHDRWAVLSGGQKQNHLDLVPYGVDGYMSTFMHFLPEIARRYWDAIQAGRLADAAGLIRDHDLPYFDLIMGLPGSFDAGFHGTLEVFGLAGRWRRTPYHSLTDAEMDLLRSHFVDRGLL